MRRQYLLASAAAIALAAPAFAAEPPPYVPPPAPIFTWTGLYIGGQIGGAWGRDPTVVSGFVPPILFFSGFNNNPSGVIGGAHIGYNLQINQWVAGIEGTVDGTSLSRTSIDPFTAMAVRTREQVQGSVRGRLGIAFDRVLIYGTGGAAFTGIDTDYFDTTGFVTGFPGTLERVSRTRSGWTAGGGLEYALTDAWSIGAEYRYSDFGHYVDYPFAFFVPLGGLFAVQHHLTEHQVQFRFSYKFVTSPFAPVAAKY